MQLQPSGHLQCTVHCLKAATVDQQQLAAELAAQRALDSKMLMVEVLRAEGLRDTQVFGDQDPYVIASWLPEKKDISTEGGEMYVARSSTAVSAGVMPNWDLGAMNNKLLLKPSQFANGLSLQVWNENRAFDDVIGQSKLNLDPMEPDSVDGSDQGENNSSRRESNNTSSGGRRGSDRRASGSSRKSNSSLVVKRAMSKEGLTPLKRVDWGTAIVYGKPTRYPIDTGGELICNIRWINMVTDGGGTDSESVSASNGVMRIDSAQNYVKKSSPRSRKKGGGLKAGVTICATLPKMPNAPTRKFKVDSFFSFKKKIREVGVVLSSLVHAFFFNSSCIHITEICGRGDTANHIY